MRTRIVLYLCVSIAPVLSQTEGLRRGVLMSPGGELPFMLSEISGPFAIYHGDHRLIVGTEWGDPMRISFPPYDSAITYRKIENEHVGVWRKTGPKGDVEMPFRWEPWTENVDPAYPYRRVASTLFPLPGDPLDISGRWAVRFKKDEGPAVAIFERSRNHMVKQEGEVQGTILTVTGDYRYLAGTARGDSFRFSCFDGAHAFLFHAKLLGDGTLSGDFWSGDSYHDTWTARRDPEASMPDPFTLTRAKNAQELADLRLPDSATREQRRIGDLLGKANLIVLFGTWCPNCNDAAELLKDLERTYGPRGLRVVGIAFEHGDDPARHRRILEGYRNRHDITWPILLGGISDKSKASEAFPILDAVRAYPTTLFVDQNGRIDSIHQGFSGPATKDAHATQFKAFVSRIEKLLR